MIRISICDDIFFCKKNQCYITLANLLRYNFVHVTNLFVCVYSFSVCVNMKTE